MILRSAIRRFWHSIDWWNVAVVMLVLSAICFVVFAMTMQGRANKECELYGYESASSLTFFGHATKCKFELEVEYEDLVNGAASPRTQQN